MFVFPSLIRELEDIDPPRYQGPHSLPNSLLLLQASQSRKVIQEESRAPQNHRTLSACPTPPLKRFLVIVSTTLQGLRHCFAGQVGGGEKCLRKGARLSLSITGTL